MILRIRVQARPLIESFGRTIHLAVDFARRQGPLTNSNGEREDLLCRGVGFEGCRVWLSCFVFSWI